jgi:hypothetical protein
MLDIITQKALEKDRSWLKATHSSQQEGLNQGSIRVLGSSVGYHARGRMRNSFRAIQPLHLSCLQSGS